MSICCPQSAQYAMPLNRATTRDPGAVRVSLAMRSWTSSNSWRLTIASCAPSLRNHSSGARGSVFLLRKLGV